MDCKSRDYLALNEQLPLPGTPLAGTCVAMPTCPAIDGAALAR
jgi:hypothetical protein